MARKISELRTVNKAANTSREYLLLSNIDSNSSTKIGLNDVLPTLQSGKATSAVTEGTSGTTPQDLFIGGGVGSSVANTDKSILIFKGIRVDDDNGALKVRTDKSTADATKQNVVVELNQSSIKLNVADNTTSKFLSEANGSNALNLGTANHVAGTLPVDHGGTGRTTLTDGALLVGNGTTGVDTVGTMALGALVVGAGSGTNPSVLTVGTNDKVLVADSTAPNGVKWGDPVIKTTSFGSELVTNGNDIKLGGGRIRGSANTSQGIALNTTSDYVFIGGGTTYYDTVLNIAGDLTLGANDGATAQKIQARTCSNGASPSFTLKGSDNSDSNNGGNIIIQGGTGQTNGAGGHTIIAGGTGLGTGDDGEVRLQTATSTILTIDKEGHSTFSDQVAFTDRKGVLAKGTTTVTQATSITTGVTINSFAGVITLHATAITNNTEQEFTVTNSVVGTDSIIIVSVQDATADAAGATLCATVNSIAGGSFKIRLTNPGTAATGTSNKIHFFVINVEA